MKTETIKAAAQILKQRRDAHSDGPRLPPHLRPTSLNEALAIQDAVTRAMIDDNFDAVAGWKCLLPPEGKQIVAPLFQSQTYNQSPCALTPLNECAAIEPEIAFKFAHDLPPREKPYSEQDVRAAIQSHHLAFELIKSRYVTPEDCEFPELLADGLFNQGVFVGPAFSNTPQAKLELTLHTSQGTQHITGQHPNLAPFAPLVWLANHLNQRGGGIQAGQVVITGSYAGVLSVGFHETIQIEYEGLGQMSALFVPHPENP